MFRNALYIYNLFTGVQLPPTFGLDPGAGTTHGHLQGADGSICPRGHLKVGNIREGVKNKLYFYTSTFKSQFF